MTETRNATEKQDSQKIDLSYEALEDRFAPKVKGFIKKDPDEIPGRGGR